MKNRYRIEIYDEVKQNDVTIFSEQGVDRDYLTEMVFSNLTKFSGNVKAYVFDQIKKKKTVAIYIPMETTQFVKSKLPTKPNVQLV